MITDQRWQFQWVWKIQWEQSSRCVSGFLPDARLVGGTILYEGNLLLCSAWWTLFTLSACRTPRRWCTQTIKMCIWDPGERPGVGRQIWELLAHTAFKLREYGIREVGQEQISERLSLILRGKQRKKNPKSNWERMLRRRTERKRTYKIKNQQWQGDICKREIRWEQDAKDLAMRGLLVTSFAAELHWHSRGSNLTLEGFPEEWKWMEVRKQSKS